MKLRDEWRNIIERALISFSFMRLQRWLKHEQRDGKKILPSEDDVFEAFNNCPPNKVKVIIIGSDPYPIPGIADGLAFSCQVEREMQPSLRNIFKELEADLQVKRPNHGCLLKWAKQGILLLNSVLTVEAEKPGSHKERGWEQFTDYVLSYLNSLSSPKVFMLWGSEALKKEPILSNPKHLILKSTHPSPFSARVTTDKLESFLGSRPFSRANQFLVKNDIKPIDWHLPDML